ncbi:MAG: DUF3991 and toprim domain-containing protein [Eubacterium sp.]|nr:DUF3991 and toprim domain-containing protein [Eubacterium sp.]
MSVNTYIPFSEQDKLRASEVDLVLFLQCRGERLERVGSNHKLIYTDGSGTHDSIMISGNRWFDHKNKCGGGPIKFLREHYGLSYQDAMIKLLGRNFSPEIQREKCDIPQKEVKKEFRLPEANGNMRRAFAYLTKQRHIDPDVISFFAHEHKLYEDKEHHNIVFVGMDENGKPCQAHKRSTVTFGKSFRQTVEGSDTRYSFSHFGGSEKIFVFEAPIDMLSFITLYKNNWHEHNYIAMNGIYENAVLKALGSHSNISEIYLCTDNDVGGIDAAYRLRDILNENGYTKIGRTVSQNKYWNEDLKALYGIEPVPAVPHIRREKYLSFADNLQYKSVQLNRLVQTISSAENYLSAARILLSASAVLISRTRDIPTNEMFEKLKNGLKNQYKSYADKGTLSSKISEFDKLKKTVDFKLRKSAFSESEIKDISKALFECAECALRCNTEQFLAAENREELSEENSLALKM